MPNDLIKLRRLMKAAHYMQDNNPVILRGHKIDQSNALKYAWWFEDFRNKLRTGAWQFSYFKTDGTIRMARGTLSPAAIPEDKKPKILYSVSGIENYGVFTYWDLDRGAWRSFRLDNFIGFCVELK